MKRVALDTSVAVPLVIRNHDDHRAVRSRIGSRIVTMTAHSLAETYSVLTRLPGDARVLPYDAARLLGSGFAPPLLLDPDVAAVLPEVLANHGIAGGAVYDALVALAVKGSDATLLTRDQRAAATYSVLNVPVEFV
jgi:predicted nucleic acid-binding protein